MCSMCSNRFLNFNHKKFTTITLIFVREKERQSWRKKIKEIDTGVHRGGQEGALAPPWPAQIVCF